MQAYPMQAYDTRLNAAALKSHDDLELQPEPLALPPKRGESKLRLAYGLSAIALLFSVGAWLGAPARTVTVLTLIPTATVAFSIPPDAGETWNVDPIVSGGVETKIGTARYYYNNSLCGLVAAAVEGHGDFFSKRAEGNQQDGQRAFLDAVPTTLCANPDQSEDEYLALLHGMLGEARGHINR